MEGAVVQEQKKTKCQHNVCIQELLHPVHIFVQCTCWRDPYAKRIQGGMEFGKGKHSEQYDSQDEKALPPN